MKRTVTVAMGLALAGVILNFAACSSSSDTPAAGSEAGADGETPAELSKYRPATEAGSSAVIQFGEAGAPTACAARPAPSADLVRSCVLRTSCIPDEPPYKISDCISQNLTAGDNEAACVTTAATCADLNSCIDQGFNGKTCAYGDHGTHCYDNVIVSCDDTPRSFYDCTKEGKTCLLDEDASTTGYPCLGSFSAPPFPDPEIDCSEWNFYPAACAKSGAPTDAGGGEGGASDGGGGSAHQWSVYCYQGVTLGVDCTALGEECVGYADGAECRAPNGQGACAGDGGAATCTGSVLANCSATRKETHDCAAAGLKCISEDNKADCLLPGCTVDDAEQCQESCDGPFASVCVGGGRYVVDCRDYGFRRCQTYTSSADKFNGDYAVCVLF